MNKTFTTKTLPNETKVRTHTDEYGLAFRRVRDPTRSLQLLIVLQLVWMGKMLENPTPNNAYYPIEGELWQILSTS